MDRAFIATPKAVAEHLRQLQLLKSDDWEPIFVDPETGTKWIGYRLDDNLGDQPPNKLRLYELSSVIAAERAAYTNFDDEAAAAGHFIRWSMSSDSAFENLVSTLEAAVSHTPSMRTYRNVLLALAWSELDNPINRRSIVGKDRQQVEFDYSFYFALANRAKSLIELSVERLGYEIQKDPSVFKDC
jgi:hypothetical protein